MVSENSSAKFCGLRSGCEFLSSVVAINDDDGYMINSLLHYSHKDKDQFFKNGISKTLDIIVSVKVEGK